MHKTADSYFELEHLLSSQLLNISDYSYDVPALPSHSYTAYFCISQLKNFQVSCFKLFTAA